MVSQPHQAAMQAAPHGGGGHGGGYGAYATGFILSVVLTVAAFYPVMVPGTVPQGWVVPIIVVLAAVQVVVHLGFFLHMSISEEQRWNVMAFAFAVLTLFILIVGSLWIMHNMSENMIMHNGMDVPAAPTGPETEGLRPEQGATQNQ
jgi:cytochrome o ubiquinol oxidase subunit IV